MWQVFSSCQKMESTEWKRCNVWTIQPWWNRKWRRIPITFIFCQTGIEAWSNIFFNHVYNNSLWKVRSCFLSSEGHAYCVARFLITDENIQTAPHLFYRMLLIIILQSLCAYRATERALVIWSAVGQCMFGLILINVRIINKWILLLWHLYDPFQCLNPVKM